MQPGEYIHGKNNGLAKPFIRAERGIRLRQRNAVPTPGGTRTKRVCAGDVSALLHTCDPPREAKAPLRAALSPPGHLGQADPNPQILPSLCLCQGMLWLAHSALPIPVPQPEEDQPDISWLLLEAKSKRKWEMHWEGKEIFSRRLLSVLLALQKMFQLSVRTNKTDSKEQMFCF